jgi:hypothetical protein
VGYGAQGCDVMQRVRKIDRLMLEMVVQRRTLCCTKLCVRSIAKGSVYFKRLIKRMETKSFALDLALHPAHSVDVYINPLSCISALNIKHLKTLIISSLPLCD